MEINRTIFFRSNSGVMVTMVKIQNNLGQQVRIIKLNNMHLANKDILEITEMKDFLYMIHSDNVVYESDGFYYILSGEVAWTIKKN